MLSSHLPIQLWSTSFLVYKHWTEAKLEDAQHPPPCGAEYCTAAPLTLASLSADRKMRDHIKLAARKWKTEEKKSAYLLSSISLRLSPQIPHYFASWYHAKIQRWNYQWPEAVFSSDLIQTPIHEKYPTFCEH